MTQAFMLNFCWNQIIMLDFYWKKKYHAGLKDNQQFRVQHLHETIGYKFGLCFVKQSVEEKSFHVSIFASKSLLSSSVLTNDFNSVNKMLIKKQFII